MIKIKEEPIEEEKRNEKREAGQDNREYERKRIKSSKIKLNK